MTVVLIDAALTRKQEEQVRNKLPNDLQGSRR